MRTSVATLAILLALALPACNRGGQVAQDPTDPAPSTTAPQVTSPDSATEPAADATEPVGPGSVQVFYARDTERGVFVEPEQRTPSESTVAVARAALTILVTERPDDPGLVNLIPDGTSLLGVDLDGTTLTVDLDLPRANLGAAFETAMYQQIVHTGAQFATVESVLILDDGETPESGHLDLGEPIQPDEFALAPIIITSPAEGETVAAGEVTLTGTANVFEANVELRLVDPDEQVVEETFTTATCGTGCRGDWEHTFTVTEPGRWTIVAVEPDMSDGEGFGPYVTERHFTVR
jgi:hypothetical protein